MQLGPYISKIYEYAGMYDILIGIPLLLFPNFVFNLFNITEIKGSNPFVVVTGASLIVIGYLLISYKEEALVHQDIGYCSVFIRFIYATIIGINLFQRSYHVLFIIFAITDLITGIILLIAIIQADVLYTRIQTLQQQ